VWKVETSNKLVSRTPGPDLFVIFDPDVIGSPADRQLVAVSV
jgi:hypothetical protein